MIIADAPKSAPEHQERKTSVSFDDAAHVGPWSEIVDVIDMNIRKAALAIPALFLR